jgi:hypothetical protein
MTRFVPLARHVARRDHARGARSRSPMLATPAHAQFGFGGSSSTRRTMRRTS